MRSNCPWNFQNLASSLICLSLFALHMSPAASAQLSEGQHASAVTKQGSLKTKALAFETFSMRPSDPHRSPGYDFEIVQNGVNVHNYALGWIIMLAYYPQGRAYWTGDRLLGGPSWVGSDHYDIEARVSEADLLDWRKQGQDEAILKQMLHASLTERCRLALHHTQKERPVYALIVGKKGPKLAKADASAPLPIGSAPLADGGGVVPVPRGSTNPVLRFTDITMRQLAAFVMRTSDRPVLDETDLPGRYDLALPIEIEEPTTSMVASQTGHPPFDLSAVGLGLRSVKRKIDVLVIDHIEKPSPN